MPFIKSSLNLFFFFFFFSPQHLINHRKIGSELQNSRHEYWHDFCAFKSTDSDASQHNSIMRELHACEWRKKKKKWSNESFFFVFFCRAVSIACLMLDQIYVSQNFVNKKKINFLALIPSRSNWLIIKN